MPRRPRSSSARSSLRSSRPVSRPPRATARTGADSSGGDGHPPLRRGFPPPPPVHGGHGAAPGPGQPAPATCRPPLPRRRRPAAHAPGVVHRARPSPAEVSPSSPSRRAPQSRRYSGAPSVTASRPSDAWRASSVPRSRSRAPSSSPPSIRDSIPPTRRSVSAGSPVSFDSKRAARQSALLRAARGSPRGPRHAGVDGSSPTVVARRRCGPVQGGEDRWRPVSPRGGDCCGSVRRNRDSRLRARRRHRVGEGGPARLGAPLREARRAALIPAPPVLWAEPGNHSRERVESEASF